MAGKIRAHVNIPLQANHLLPVVYKNAERPARAGLFESQVYYSVFN
jgi:hypothetical protein